MPVPCTDCDRQFASIGDLQQHARDKHHKSLTQAPTVQEQPPAQLPRAQTQNKSAPTPAPSVSEPIICEHCLVHFTSLKSVKQHKIRFHSWKCAKCPALPPFENGTAWQAHFKEVHATATRSGEAGGTKGEKEVAPISKGKTNDKQSDASHDTNIEVEAQGVPAQPEPSSSGLAKMRYPIISSPPSEVLTPSVDQGQIGWPASDDKVKSQRTSPSSEGQIASSDEGDRLSSKGPTLNVLVAIDPEPRRGRDETTYEIASDTWSPTMTVSSIGGDQHEEEYDIPGFPSHSLEPLNGSSLQKQQHIIVPPRGPKPGEQERRALGATATGNNPRYEPGVQAQNGLDGVTSSNRKERYEGARSDSPISTTVSSRGAGIDTNQGDLPHDPLRTHRSKLGSPEAEIHFRCRICLSDPTRTSNVTATHCGHLFCYECIAAEVLRTSRCPVCKNVLALYCLFKLDVGS